MKNLSNQFLPFLLLQIILLFTCLSSLSPAVNAQDDALVLEWEQHWPTYGVGGTCNFGTHNFFVGDVDGDGVVEFVTGGMTYSGDYHDASEVEARAEMNHLLFLTKPSLPSHLANLHLFAFHLTPT